MVFLFFAMGKKIGPDFTGQVPAADPQGGHLQVFLGLCMAQGAVSEPFQAAPNHQVLAFSVSLGRSIHPVTIEKVGLNQWSRIFQG